MVAASCRSCMPTSYVFVGKSFVVMWFLRLVATNFFSRTRRWLACNIYRRQLPYMNNLPASLQSWLTLLLRASTSNGTQASILRLIPRFHSLEVPPQEVLTYFESLVEEVHQQIGSRPVTTEKASKTPEKYLPWLYKVLPDLGHATEHLLNQMAQPQQQQQQQQFQQQLARTKLCHRNQTGSSVLVTISTACLHR